MDEQMIRLVQEFPWLAQLVFDAINRGLSNALLPFTPEVYDQIRESRRGGYLDWMLVESQLMQDLLAVNNPRICVKWMPNNGNSHNHLEIRTPHGILMLARVKAAKETPRGTQYRQKYIDNQCFMPEAFPDFEVFSTNSIPLYVIIYSRSRTDGIPADIFVGRISQDQSNWSTLWPIQAIMRVASPEEAIVAIQPEAKVEVIKASRQIRKKSV